MFSVPSQLLALQCESPVDGGSWPGVGRHQDVAHVVGQIQHRLCATLAFQFSKLFSGFSLYFCFLFYIFFFHPKKLIQPFHGCNLTKVHPNNANIGGKKNYGFLIQNLLKVKLSLWFTTFESSEVPLLLREYFRNWSK